MVQDGMDGVLAARPVARSAGIVASYACGPLSGRLPDVVRCEARSASCGRSPLRSTKYEQARSVTKRGARVVGRSPMRNTKCEQSPPDRMTSQGTLNRPPLQAKPKEHRGRYTDEVIRLDAPRFPRRSRIVDTARTGRGLVLGGAVDSSRSGVIQNLRFAGHLMRCAGLGWFLGLLRI